MCTSGLLLLRAAGRPGEAPQGYIHDRTLVDRDRYPDGSSIQSIVHFTLAGLDLSEPFLLSKRAAQAAAGNLRYAHGP